MRARSFLYVKPHPRNQLFSVLRPIRTSRSSARRATISLSVMSLSVSIRPTMKPSCPSRLDPRRRSVGRGSTSPAFARFYPADRGRWRHTEPRRRTTRRQARLRCLQNTNPQIATQCSSHPRPTCLETFNQTFIIPSHHNRFSDWWICSSCLHDVLARQGEHLQQLNGLSAIDSPYVDRARVRRRLIDLGPIHCYIGCLLAEAHGDATGQLRGELRRTWSRHEAYFDLIDDTRRLKDLRTAG